MTLLDYSTVFQKTNTEITQLNIPPTPEIRAQISIQASVHNILENINEQPQREGLLRTPERVARMFNELTEGYHVDPEMMINGTLFDVN